jgi:hypothetical protein
MLLHGGAKARKTGAGGGRAGLGRGRAFPRRNPEGSSEPESAGNQKVDFSPVKVTSLKVVIFGLSLEANIGLRFQRIGSNPLCTGG